MRTKHKRQKIRFGGFSTIQRNTRYCVCFALLEQDYLSSHKRRRCAVGFGWNITTLDSYTARSYVSIPNEGTHDLSRTRATQSRRMMSDIRVSSESESTRPGGPLSSRRLPRSDSLSAPLPGRSIKLRLCVHPAPCSNTSVY